MNIFHPPKILITGASGFIGSYFMNYFSKQGYKVTGIVRNREKIKGEFQYIICDLAKEINFEHFFDIIIHCAAELDNEEKKMESYVEGNIIATYNLLNYAKRKNVNRIINLNSVRCFGKVKVSEISEQTPTFEPGYYGITKLIAEKILLDSPVKTISLILPGVVGVGGHIPWIMRISRALQENAVIDCYEPDAMFNNIIHVDTLAKNVNKLLAMEILKNDRVLLGSRNPISKYETICILKDGLESQSEIRIVESKDISFCLNIKKAKNMGIILPEVEEELNKLIREIK